MEACHIFLPHKGLPLNNSRIGIFDNLNLFCRQDDNLFFQFHSKRKKKMKNF